MGNEFPDGFLFGAATAAYQVEGFNKNSDWWKIEKEIEPDIAESGGADHYRRFREDFKLAKDLGLNAQRLSLEWGRIEPKEGVFDQKEINHYKEVLQFLKDNGFKVFLTLHHFSTPIWFNGKGGWENLEAAKKFFGRFVELCCREFLGDVDAAITINEPNLYSGIYPLLITRNGSSLASLESLSPRQTFRIYHNLLCVHRDVFRRIKKFNPTLPTGLAVNFQCFDPYDQSFPNRLGGKIVNLVNEFPLRNVLKNYSDFIGVNYYFHLKVRFNPLRPRRLLEFYNGDGVMMSLGSRGATVKFDLSGVNRGPGFSDIDWETYPQCLYRVLSDLKKYHKPIYVTENGISDAADSRREKYVREHLVEISKALRDGADVRGYFYWSLIDNFEWFQGYKPRFGLVEVNYQTGERKVRQSAYFLADVAKTLKS